MNILLPPSHAETQYSIDADRPDHRARAVQDLRLGFLRWRLAATLAWLDLRNRYRGSVFGPFWLTLSTAVMVAGLGVLYGALFKIPLREYLPHLAVSLVMWNLIAAIIADACTCLTAQESVIRQLPLPFTTHVLRCVLRTGVIGLHNLPLIVLVFLVTGTVPGPEAVLALPGLAIFLLDAFAAALFLGMISARFRDIQPIVTNGMQLAFFMTPVLWKPELLGKWQWVLLFNPFYTVLETVRGPLLEGGGSPWAWLCALLYSSVGLVIAWVFFVRFRGRIAFWV